jgi:hypothetical protein
VFLDKDRTMDNVQKHSICTNVPSSQTFRARDCVSRFVSADVTVTCHTAFETVTRDGEEYLHVRDLKWALGAGTSHFRFNNLFGGDNALGKHNFCSHLAYGQRQHFQDSHSCVTKWFARQRPVSRGDYLVLRSGALRHETSLFKRRQNTFRYSCSKVNKRESQ